MGYDTDALSLSHLSNETLLAEARQLAACERRATARLIAALMELDVRRLYLGEGCSSLFTYCTQMLHLSEHAAYGRIEAARAARRFPVLLELLEAGELTLTAVGLLGRHLTAENHRSVLDAARHQGKREVERLVARLNPQPDVPAVVRKQPQRAAQRCAADATSLAVAATVQVSPASTVPAIVRPLAPERYRVQFTVSRETHDKLRRAQDLLRHSLPDADPAAIFDEALTILLQHLERVKTGATERPRPSRTASKYSRHVPAATRREVWTRDGGRCAFVGPAGRCTETAFLEFHHVVPFAAGGETVADNLALRCRAHNCYEAERYFGPWLLKESASGFL